MIVSILTWSNFSWRLSFKSANKAITNTQNKANEAINKAANKANEDIAKGINKALGK